MPERPTARKGGEAVRLRSWIIPSLCIFEEPWDIPGVLFYISMNKRATTRGGNQKVKRAQPKSYQGVDYKSGLEVYCARALERAGLPNNYEQVTFTLMEGFECPATSWEFKPDKKGMEKQKLMLVTSPKIRKITLTPDFPCMKEGWVIECKGLKTDSFTLKFKLWKKYLCEHNLPLTIYLPNNQAQVDQAIQHILENRLQQAA